MKPNSITTLFGIQYPIIQGGMIWCSGWRLASAVSNAGGLGLLGIGSMHPETLEEHILKMQQTTDKPWGVNLPLFYPELDRVVELILKHDIKIVFTSAGSPAKLTPLLKKHGITVAHVIANTRFAKKCEEVGVDALVAEGFEAGGHNSPQETTTMAMIPLIRDCTTLPLMAAGGIGSGRQMAAALALGADGVQVGSLFAASEESSAHEGYKQAILAAQEGATVLTLKELGPVRLIPNAFTEEMDALRNQGASVEEMRQLLGKGRAKKGIFLGDTQQGEIEIGQVASMIQKIEPASLIIHKLMTGCEETITRLQQLI